jgi:amidase
MYARLSVVALLLGQALAKKRDIAYTPTNLLPLQENAGSDALFPMADCQGFDLHEATIDEMQEAMRAGHLTSVQLVTCYMIRNFQTQNYLK